MSDFVGLCDGAGGQCGTGAWGRDPADDFGEYS